uniref:G_PROTEIN_RECEP_F1_2 domain-containing protein n=1 Tax=Ascaris lumbricoides TaxID=6252 RepID=A0A0M3IFI1_ASCLU
MRRAEKYLFLQPSQIHRRRGTNQALGNATERSVHSQNRNEFSYYCAPLLFFTLTIDAEDERSNSLSTVRPYFVQLMLKVMLVDILLTLALIMMVLVHRMHIIPARRRYKIVTHLLKRKKKRALKDRAERRLRRLNFLKRKLWGVAKQDDSSSSTRTKTKGTTTLVTAAENMTTNENVTGIPPTTSTGTHAHGLTQSKGTEA